jgi:hypothetical protein
MKREWKNEWDATPTQLNNDHHPNIFTNSALTRLMMKKNISQHQSKIFLQMLLFFFSFDETANARKKRCMVAYICMAMTMCVSKSTSNHVPRSLGNCFRILVEKYLYCFRINFGVNKNYSSTAPRFKWTEQRIYANLQTVKGTRFDGWASMKKTRKYCSSITYQIEIESKHFSLIFFSHKNLLGIVMLKQVNTWEMRYSH